MAQASANIRADGPRLLRERRRRKLTRLKAAVAIGISPVTLARAENGDTVQPKTLAQIAEFYELAINKIGRAS